MTDDPKKRLENAMDDLNLNLGGLFGTLGEAINEMITRLDDGNSGAVQREHTFETAKGPVKAQAGIRLRMGGADVATRTPKPVNPQRKPQTAPPDAPAVRDLMYDLFEDTGGWRLTADLPGVSRKDITLSGGDAMLVITTEGARRYRAEVPLAERFDRDEIKISLRNGILDLQIPRADHA